MARKKSTKPTLNVLPSSEPVQLLSREAEDELRELIRSINTKAKPKRDGKDGPHREHGPEFPPAA